MAGASDGDGELGDGANGGVGEAVEVGRRAAAGGGALELQSGACEARGRQDTGSRGVRMGRFGRRVLTLAAAALRVNRTLMSFKVCALSMMRPSSIISCRIPRRLVKVYFNLE